MVSSQGVKNKVWAVLLDQSMGYVAFGGAQSLQKVLFDPVVGLSEEQVDDEEDGEEDLKDKQ